MFANFTDTDGADVDVDVGSAMRMVFRIKEFDLKRGFRRDFWKATPCVSRQANDTGDA